jgi:sulfur relay (sulfurtransferase) DsrF/TusC family protein
MKALFILNDPPYGTERCYNGLRLARGTDRLDALGGARPRLLRGAGR